MDDLLHARAARMMAARPCALFEVPCRRGGARRGRHDPWRLQCRERGLSARPLRRSRAIAAMVAAGKQRIARMRRDRARARGHHAVRRLPPEAARIRFRRPADPSLRPRRAAPHRDAGPTAAAVLRPASSRPSHDDDAIASAGAGLQAEGRRRAGLGPGRLRRGREGRRHHSLWRAAGLSRRPTSAATPASSCWATSARRRSPCCRAARTTTSAAGPTR